MTSYDSTPPSAGAPDEPRRGADLFSVEDALTAALSLIPAPQATEQIALADAAGRVLARDITADRDMPACDRAQLDGYALRAADAQRGARVPVFADCPAGSAPPEDVPPGACVRIATGAAVPTGLDCVIPHEETDRGDPVLLHEEGRAGRAIHPRGADARAGSTILCAGVVLSPVALAAAASSYAPAATVTVFTKPTVTLLTSGDEVRPIDTESLRSFEVRNSNEVLVRAMLARFGADVTAHAHLSDDFARTRERVQRAVNDGTALLVTVGGVSAGERDHFPAAFDAAGIRLAVRGVAMQPGKPIAIGRSASGMIVLALPGNPLSALVGLALCGGPIVRALCGASDPLPRWTNAVLASAVTTPAHRRAYRPARQCGSGTVEVMSWHGSGNLCGAAACDGIAELPPPGAPADAGTAVRFLPW